MCRMSLQKVFDPRLLRWTCRLSRAEAVPVFSCHMGSLRQHRAHQGDREATHITHTYSNSLYKHITLDMLHCNTHMYIRYRMGWSAGTVCNAFVKVTLTWSNTLLVLGIKPVTHRPLWLVDVYLPVYLSVYLHFTQFTKIILFVQQRMHKIHNYSIYYYLVFIYFR